MYHQGDRLAPTFSKSSTIAAPHWPFSDSCSATTATSCLLCSLPSLSAHAALAQSSWHSSALAFQPDSYQMHSQFRCSILNFQVCVPCFNALLHTLTWSCGFPTPSDSVIFFHSVSCLSYDAYDQPEQAPSLMVSNNLKLSNPS